MSLPAAIVLDRVTKVYDEPVVSDVSLDVQEGNFVTLLGPSGAGKTTILQMIGGFVQPSCGAQALSSREAERRWACRARNADWLARHGRRKPRALPSGPVWSRRTAPIRAIPRRSG